MDNHSLQNTLDLAMKLISIGLLLIPATLIVFGFIKWKTSS
jgi:hypothetical protein